MKAKRKKPHVMTQAQALRKARELLGPKAAVEQWPSGASYVGVLFAGMFVSKGSGGSWKEAFANLKQRGGV